MEEELKNHKSEQSKDFVTNDIIVHSFDLVNPLAISNKFKPRRFFGVSTLEYNENENKFIYIFRPRNHFFLKF